MTPHRRESLALAAMVTATLLWGGTFVAIRDTVSTVNPATLVCLRFSVAAILFGLLILLRRRFPPMRDLLAGLFTGFLMLGGYWFQAEGLRTASAGSSAFLTCAGTLMAAVFAWPLIGQRPNRTLAAGLALAFAGSALLSLRDGLQIGRGELLTLVGASIYALQIVSLAKFAPTADPLALTFGQSVVVAGVLLPFSGDALQTLRAFDGSAWGRFAYLAIAGSTLAPLFQVWAQSALSAGRIALLFALEPVFALVFALTLGAERFAARWWIGAVLILSAVVLVEWRAAKSTRPPASS